MNTLSRPPGFKVFSNCMPFEAAGTAPEARTHLPNATADWNMQMSQLLSLCSKLRSGFRLQK